MKASTLGKHWILDAYNCDQATLKDARIFRKLLTDLPIAMNMNPVSEPQIHVSDTTIAALVLIAESHISLHASLSKQYLHADVFSCGAFDSQIALNMLKSRFVFDQYTEEQFDR